MYEFKEELDLDDPAKAIQTILDTPLVNLEGHHNLKIRIINMLEENLSCVYVRDLLSITKSRLADVRGFGTLETHRLKLCLIDIQKLIDILDYRQRRQWKEAQCKQSSSQVEPVTSVAM